MIPDLQEPYASAAQMLTLLKSLVHQLPGGAKGEGFDASMLLQDTLADAKELIAKADVPAPTPLFTVFCQEKGVPGDTVHISTHSADSLEEAIAAGRRECLDDWSNDSDFEDLDSIHCLGVAAGGIHILHWEDQNHAQA